MAWEATPGTFGVRRLLRWASVGAADCCWCGGFLLLVRRTAFAL